jgi:hypothetical protein
VAGQEVSNYGWGTQLEYWARDYYLEHGCPFVVRTAGSHGVADLVAVWQDGRVELVSCRSTHKKKADSRGLWSVEELYDLRKAADTVKATAVLVSRTGQRRAIQYVVMGGKLGGEW